jgi:demethylmenaquinone methyltransferase/2-methoxy-6-polyprenyl-1,4-benzoquinol methylase
VNPAASGARPATAGDRPGADPARDGGPAMFDSIAGRYDFLNRVLSAGFDVGWRRRAIRELDPKPGNTILDLCTGTGDFAFAALARSGTRVLGLDVAREMVKIGRGKVRKTPLELRVRFGLGDAESLPLPDRSVDGATIAFGIRNVADRARALSELARVVRSGGRLVILEFGVPPNRLFRTGYFFYFRHILPAIGGILSGNRGAYEYLPDSVRRFPDPGNFAALCRRAGFSRVDIIRLTGGIVNLYKCTR